MIAGIGGFLLGTIAFFVIIGVVLGYLAFGRKR